MERVLGPAEDLLAWIPKEDGPPRASNQRPLQLPSTIRRLFAAGWAGIIGPIVEPRLTPEQAAKAGGSCGPHVREAYRHLH
eukprot:1066295-Prorocentrum_lima.AAC.1